MTDTKPHDRAYPLEARKGYMHSFVAGSAKRGTLGKIVPAEVAKTYDHRGRILPCEVEAEILKYPIEECGK